MSSCSVTAGLTSASQTLPHFNHAHTAGRQLTAARKRTHQKHKAALQRQHQLAANLSQPVNLGTVVVPAVTPALAQAHKALLDAATDELAVKIGQQTANNYKQMPFTSGGQAILNNDLTTTAPVTQTADALRKSARAALDRAAAGETRTLTEEEYALRTQALHPDAGCRRLPLRATVRQ